MPDEIEAAVEATRDDEVKVIVFRGAGRALNIADIALRTLGAVATWVPR